MKIDPLWFCGSGQEGAERQAAIAREAYYRAERRGFEPGHELEDWLAAEAEFNRLVSGGAKTLGPGHPQSSSTGTEAHLVCEATS